MWEALAVAGSRRIGRGGIARLLMVCAVLAGLFLMHGAPASAAEGCHGASPASMATPVSAAMTAPVPAGSEPGARAAVVTSAGHAAMAHPGDGQAVHAGAPATRHGATCLSTPARGRTALPANALAVLVVAALAAAGAAGRVAVRGRARRRGPPPPGGRGLLLQVSVART